MARLRTFIAVDIGKAIRGRAVALQETLARAGTDVKWVEPENLHVTMSFLGEVDDRTVPDVCRVVTDCSQPGATCLVGADNGVEKETEHLRYKFTSNVTAYLILDSYDLNSFGDWTLVGGMICTLVGVDPTKSAQDAVRASIVAEAKH